MRSLAIIAALFTLAQASRPSKCFVNLTELGADAQSVTLGYNDWESSRIITIIADILLSEKSGIRVTRIPTTETTQWEMLESETLQAVLEVWPSRNVVNRTQYVAVRASVEMAGLLGIKGQVGWYMSKYSSSHDGELDKPIWKDLKNQSRAELFNLQQQTAQMPVSSWPGYSANWVPKGQITAIESSFVKPSDEPFNQYQFAQGTKGNVLCDTPGRMDAVDEYLIDNLDLQYMEPVYTGSFESLRDKVSEMYAANTDMIIKTWSPNYFFLPETNQTWKRILLPTATDRCTLLTNAQKDCDYPEDSLYKIASQNLKQDSNRAYQLIRKFAITDDQIVSMLSDLSHSSEYDGYSADDKEWMTACNFLKNNEVWKTWIPEVSCELGYVRNLTALDGVGECQICHPGNYSDSVDLMTCKVCAKGLFSSQNGTSVCTECAQGEFSAQEGATSCQVCPSSTTTYMLGSTAAENCTCIAGTYQPDSIAGAQCTKCPEGGKCPGGLVQPFAQTGYFQVSDIVFRECNPATVCTGGADSSAVCREGHTGTMCTECIEGHFLLHKECEPCSGDQPASGAWMFGGCLCALGACLTLTLLSQGHSWLGSAAISVNFIQIFARFERFDLNWPSAMDHIYDMASMFNFNIDLLQIQCSGSSPPDYAGKFCFSLAVPLMAAFGFAVLFALAVFWEWIVGKLELRGRFSDGKLVRMLALNEGAEIDRTDVLNALHGGYVSFLMFAYIFISYKPLELFDCTQQPDAVYTLDADPSIICWEGTHLHLLPIGAVGILLYTIGVPLVLTVQVYRHRDELSSPKFASRYGCFYREYYTKQLECEAEQKKAAPKEEDEEDDEEEEEVSDWNFKTGNLYMWELTVMARKLAFNITLYFTRYSTVNSVFAQIILITSLTYHLLMQPYTNSYYDYYDSVLLFTLISVLFCGQVIYKNESGGITKGYEAMLAMLLGFAALLIVLFLLRDLILKLKKMHADDSEEEDTKETKTEMVSPNDRKDAARPWTQSEVLEGSKGKIDEDSHSAACDKVFKGELEPEDKSQSTGSNPIQDMPM